MIDDATDRVYSVGRDTFTKFPSVPDKDPITLDLSASRVNQQMMLPASIKARILGDIISTTSDSGSTEPLISSSVQILTGKSQSFLFTVADSMGRAIVAIPDVAVYVTSLGTGELWPNATYNMTNLPVCIYNDQSQTSQNNVVTRVQIGNTSGGSVSVAVACSWRIITQPSNSYATATVTSSVAANSV